MSEFQTLLALVVLIYALCVIAQAIQEILKPALKTKAKTMKEVVEKYMGEKLLTSKQVGDALEQRGLNITALENFNKADFRRLMDGIKFTPDQINQIKQIPGIAGLETTVLKDEELVKQFKDHAEAAYDGTMAKFQQSYATRTKWWVLGISLVVVLVLNANVIMIYQQLNTDQVMAQAIAGAAAKITSAANVPATGQTKPDETKPASPQADNSQNLQQAGATDLGKIYQQNRASIEAQLKANPILLRWCKWDDDWASSKLYTILGLPLMAILVWLGAPFWNDVLKGMTGINNALNSGGKKTP